jgi:hypothetical protein
VGPPVDWAGLRGSGGRVVTNGIRADPRGCAYGSVCTTTYESVCGHCLYASVAG